MSTLSKENKTNSSPLWDLLLYLQRDCGSDSTRTHTLKICIIWVIVKEKVKELCNLFLVTSLNTGEVRNLPHFSFLHLLSTLLYHNGYDRTIVVRAYLEHGSHIRGQQSPETYESRFPHWGETWSRDLGIMVPTPRGQHSPEAWNHSSHTGGPKSPKTWESRFSHPGDKKPQVLESQYSLRGATPYVW